MMSFGLKGSLRGQNITPELQRLLPPEELRWASQSSHMPNTVSQVPPLHTHKGRTMYDFGSNEVATEGRGSH